MYKKDAISIIIFMNILWLQISLNAWNSCSPEPYAIGEFDCSHCTFIGYKRMFHGQKQYMSTQQLCVEVINNRSRLMGPDPA